MTGTRRLVGLWFVAWLGLAMPALAKHSALSLEEKIAQSGWILVGTVEAVRDAPGGPASEEPDLLETASKVALVRVEDLLHGSSPGEVVSVGFRYAYRCGSVNLEVGQRVLLFLQRTAAPYLAPVNWQFGVSVIEQGHLQDPRDPYSDKRISEEEALTWVRLWTAIRKGGLEPDGEPRKAPMVSGGRVDIDGREALVLVAGQGEETRVLIVMPDPDRSAAVPADRIDVWMLAQGGQAISRSGAPIHTGGSVEYRFPVRADRADLAFVVVSVDGSATAIPVPRR